jgi:ribosome-binding factor A
MEHDTIMSKRIRKEKSRVGQDEGHRRIRLEHIILEELNSLLRDEVEDPNLDGVHVASVELSNDYRLAKVLYQIEPEYSLERVQLALERSASFLRSQLGDTLDTKFVPSLRFAPSVAPLFAQESPEE